MKRRSSSETTLQLTPGKPIADGIRFCEMTLLTPKMQQALAARGLIWLTEFRDGTMEVGGSVIAKDYEQAVAISDSRGLGEKVSGRMAGGDGLPHIPD